MRARDRVSLDRKEINDGAGKCQQAEEIVRKGLISSSHGLS